MKVHFLGSLLREKGLLILLGIQLLSVSNMGTANPPITIPPLEFLSLPRNSSEITCSSGFQRARAVKRDYRTSA